MANSHPPICPCSAARLGRDIFVLWRIFHCVRSRLDAMKSLAVKRSSFLPFRHSIAALYIVAPKHVVVADVEPPVGNGGIGPGVFHFCRELPLCWGRGTGFFM